ncbi:MAG: sugar phosphate nucleotidyltransferase [Planctomycetota bacterium]
MKGVILAGGSGTRLRPTTRVVNKHLLPVYDRPMITFPLQAIETLGLGEVMIVTNPGDVEDFRRVVAELPTDATLDVSFGVQSSPGGVADALLAAEAFADNGPLCVLLGDNVFENAPSATARSFESDPTGARLVLAEVDEPAGLGVAEFEGTPGASRLIRIVEKPPSPPSRFVVTGCYGYDASVFERIRSTNRSERGELEITELNNTYARDAALAYDVTRGWWADAGTPDGLLRAANLVAAGRSSAPLGPSANDP